MVTVSIIEPPVMNGGIAFSSSRRPYSTPMPLGPSILWPENAAKSTPSAWKSTGWCGTDWQASSTRQRADRLGPRDQLGDRGHRAGDVRMMAERNDFHAFVELQRVEVDAAVVGDAVPAQRRAGAPGQLLPRDQVGVVLQLGGDDDVAGADGVLEPVVPQHIGRPG